MNDSGACLGDILSNAMKSNYLDKVRHFIRNVNVILTMPLDSKIKESAVKDLQKQFLDSAPINVESAPLWLQYLVNGNKINSIKGFRATFGVSLLDAKNAIEAIERLFLK